MYRLNTKDINLKHRNGRCVTVLETHRTGTLHRVRFADGFVVPVFTDELVEATATAPAYRDTL